jgi:hypothetical protein
MDKSMAMQKYAISIICMKDNGKMGLLMELGKVRGMMINNK